MPGRTPPTSAADRDGYARRVTDHYALVLTLAERGLRGRHCGPAVDPADVAQAVVLRLLKSRAAVNRLAPDATRFVPYLRVVVRNEVSSAVRRAGRAARALDGHAAALTAAPVGADPTGERAEVVRRVLALLPDGRARYVVEHVLNGDSIKDIASELHLKPNVVSQTKCRALKALRRACSSRRRTAQFLHR